MMTGSTVSLLLMGLQLGVMIGSLVDAMPTHHEQSQQMTTNQQQNGQAAASHQSQPEVQQFQPDFDYSRFYFGNNNLGLYDKKSAQPSGYGVPSQWYGNAFPRQLAPKFKRDYNPYEVNLEKVHDKRLDEQLFDDFYNNMKNSHYEWNFNRL